MKFAKAPTIVFALLTLIVVASLVVEVVSVAFHPMETINAMEVTVDDSISAEGIFLRDEVVIDELAGSSADYMATQGQKVSRGQRVAVEYSDDSALEARQQMQALSQRIDLIGQVLDQSAQVLDTSRIDQFIANQQMQIGSTVNRGDYSQLPESLEELRMLSLQRSYSYSDTQQLKEQLQQLQNQYNELQLKVGNMTKAVSAPRAGLFSQTVDGYEQAFSTDRLQALTAKDVSDMLATEEKASATQKGGKIVSGFYWYFAALIPADKADYAHKGESYRLRFGGASAESIQAEVYDVRESEDKESLLVIFQSKNDMEQILHLRRQTVEIVRRTYTGIRIPVQALRMEGDKLGVYVLSGNLSRFRAIETVYETDSFVLAKFGASTSSNLYPQDEIIVKAKEIEDKKVVK